MACECRRMLKLFFLLIFSVFLFGNGQAQNLKSIEKKAIRSFEKENYIAAKDNFKTLYDSKWNLPSTGSYLAQCYLELHQPANAYNLLKEIENPNQNHIYLLIQASLALENFNEAKSLLNDFKDTSIYDIASLRKQIEFTSNTYNSQKGFVVQNFGPEINTSGREYSAVMYNDYNKLLYTARQVSGSNTAEDGLAYESIYETEIDSTDNWKKPELLLIDLQENRSHDATVQIYQSGKKMISYSDGELYTSTYENGTWTNHEKLEIHELEGNDTHCFMTDDEKTLYFASDFLSDNLDLDLFVTSKNENGQWTEPKPLENINTPFDEDSPFLANDGSLYFSSRGHNSMGGYDIFKSTYDPEAETWGSPVNLGYPINTVSEDTYYTTDGKIAYLSSTRKGGYGSLDLYRVFLFNKVKVQGVLYNEDQEPMSNAIIHVNYDSVTLNSYTDDVGYYEMFVPVNKEMHIKFIKDSLNQFEGDYIANIFMKDDNDNEFNFYIDYLEGEDSSQQSVKHINIEVKNDDKKNPVIASTPLVEEKVWTDSINAEAQKKIQTIKAGEVAVLKEIDSSKVEIKSENLLIRNATVEGIKRKEKQEEVLDGNENNFTNTSGAKIKNAPKGYTIQILALTSQPKPDQSYFENLESSSKVDNVKGSDGYDRYFVGEFDSKKEALKEMRKLRELGYGDAFVRKISKYYQK